MIARLCLCQRRGFLKRQAIAVSGVPPTVALGALRVCAAVLRSARPLIRGGHSKRFCLRFLRDSGLILRRIGGVKSGLSLTTPLCSEGILDAILRADGSGWLVQAEAEAEAAILEPNAPPESLLQKRRF